MRLCFARHAAVNTSPYPSLPAASASPRGLRRQQRVDPVQHVPSLYRILPQLLHHRLLHPSQHKLQQQPLSGNRGEVPRHNGAMAARVAPSALIQSTAAVQDGALSGVICIVASAWLLVLQAATGARVLSRELNRKIVHITCAPLLMLFWPLYSDLSTARLVAVLVPLFFVLRILLSVHQAQTALCPTNSSDNAHRENIAKQQLTNLAESIARTDGAALWDAARGPIVYLAVLVAVTTFLWRSSAGSAVVIGQMCFGDGFADVIGRKFGKGTEWPFARARGKTIVGTAAFLTAGFIGSCGLLSWLDYAGCIQLSIGEPSVLLSLLIISLSCATVELLLPELDDNYTVPLTAALLSWLLRV